MALITRLVALVIGLGLPLAAPATEPGFTSLFNGKDFSGWKIAGPPETFTIQDGAIVAKGAASHCYYDGPFKKHSFRDFELKVDIMTRQGSNGGAMSHRISPVGGEGGRTVSVEGLRDSGEQLAHRPHPHRQPVSRQRHLDQSPAKTTNGSPGTSSSRSDDPVSELKAGGDVDAAG